MWKLDNCTKIVQMVERPSGYGKFSGSISGSVTVGSKIFQALEALLGIYLWFDCHFFFISSLS